MILAQSKVWHGISYSRIHDLLLIIPTMHQLTTQLPLWITANHHLITTLLLTTVAAVPQTIVNLHQITAAGGGSSGNNSSSGDSSNSGTNP
jgi:hypothetical protein